MFCAVVFVKDFEEDDIIVVILDVYVVVIVFVVVINLSISTVSMCILKY